MNKVVQKWLLPQGVAEYIKQKRLQTAREKVLYPANSTFKNKYSDVKRCFILATGPSIKDEQLSTLKGEFCISVSNFFVHELYNELKPKFHVFAGSHPPITKQQYSAWLSDAVDKTKFDTTFLFSAADADVIESNKSLDQIDHIYYTPGGGFPIDFKKSIPPFRTVVHIAIYLAIYLGIKEVYLLGVDHSWIMHYGESKHFYEEKAHKLVQLNYNEWQSKNDIGRLFEGYGKTWELYRNIRAEAEKNDVQIFNLTVNSVLDIFPKKSLLEVVK